MRHSDISMVGAVNKLSDALAGAEEDLSNIDSLLSSAQQKVDRAKAVFAAKSKLNADIENAQKFKELVTAVMAFDNWQRDGYGRSDIMFQDVSRVLWDKVRAAAEIHDEPQDKVPCLFSESK